MISIKNETITTSTTSVDEEGNFRVKCKQSKIFRKFIIFEILNREKIRNFFILFFIVTLIIQF